MPNIKSAKKRVRISKTCQERNKAGKSALKTAIKKARVDISDKSAVLSAASALDRAVTKGFIHKNKASRLKSRLAKKSNNAV